MHSTLGSPDAQGVAAVAREQHELAEPLSGVDADHVLHDRPPADLGQRLRALAVEPRAAPAAEDHHLHRCKFRLPGEKPPSSALAFGDVSSRRWR
jgi:hypothetical protein